MCPLCWDGCRPSCLGLGRCLGLWAGLTGSWGLHSGLRQWRGREESYLSEDRLLWPFWRAEAQTPQRRASRCASEAAWWGEGEREGLMRNPGDPRVRRHRRGAEIPGGQAQSGGRAVKAAASRVGTACVQIPLASWVTWGGLSPSGSPSIWGDKIMTTILHQVVRLQEITPTASRAACGARQGLSECGLLCHPRHDSFLEESTWMGGGERGQGCGLWSKGGLGSSRCYHASAV